MGEECLFQVVWKEGCLGVGGSDSSSDSVAWINHLTLDLSLFTCKREIIRVPVR